MTAGTPDHETPRHGRRLLATDAHYVIPSGYGDHRIVLMVKDPWWLYAYWEIRQQVERQVRGQLQPDEFGGAQSILRVYDVTGLPDAPFGEPGSSPPPSANSSFDIGLSGLASNWFVNTNAPGRSFIVEIGLLTSRGRFLSLTRSNRVTTPRFGPSDVIDEEWMTATEAEYWQLWGLTTGVGGSSPSGLRTLIERQLFSPGLSSYGLLGGLRPQKGRGFWLLVDAELIVYGATDPRASVTVQGQSITLNADGTFSVRMALPDGTQLVPVEATAPDRQEIRTVVPRITRSTQQHQVLGQMPTSPMKSGAA